MAIPDNYIDKITKGNDSRMISPAADMVRVDNDNFDGNDLDGVLDEIAESISGAGGTAVQSVTVETSEDGTFDVNVDNDTYTINLNHTHENMAKLVIVDEEPANPALDTIYALVDDAGTPTEIRSLYIAGLEFVGGGGGTGEPRITTPADGSTIDLGTNDGSGVSKTITVRGRYLTSDLTVAVGGSDMSLTYGQTTAASVTIPLADALAGVQLTIAYSGADGFDDRTLVITHGNNVLSTSTLVVTDTWTTVDLSQNTVDAWIGSNGTFSNGSQLSTLIPPSGATQVKIKANDTRACYFLFLKSVPTFPSTSAYGPYLCTGETGRRSVAIGTTDTLNIPSGCVRIMVGLQSSPSTPLGYQPTFVKLK